MSAIEVTVGARTYLQDVETFGNIQRTSVLGLANSPVIGLDTGRSVAYFGAQRTKVVDAVEQKDIATGTSVAVPLDVKTVGYEQLTQLGVPADQQTAALLKWDQLSADARATHISQWLAVDKTDTSAVTTFVTDLMSILA